MYRGTYRVLQWGQFYIEEAITYRYLNADEQFYSGALLHYCLLDTVKILPGAGLNGVILYSYILCYLPYLPWPN